MWTETPPPAANPRCSPRWPLSADVRKRLGDTASKSERLAAGETFTTASLEALRSYSLGQEQAAENKLEEAAASYREATSQDPNFGRAYATWAAVTLSLGKRTEAEEHWKKALALLDRMTEREKYRTLGLDDMTFSRELRESHRELRRAREGLPSDFAAHNNLAIAYFSVLKFPEALEEQRQVVALYPKNVIGRTNYALFAMYAGQFETAAQQAGELVKSAPSFYQNVSAARGGRNRERRLRSRASRLRQYARRGSGRIVARPDGAGGSGAVPRTV